MSAPLSANPNPTSFDAGPLGKVYVTGAVTGFALTQDHPVPGDRSSWGDISNAQVFVQKTTGPIQFFLQVGAYSLPALGASYFKASTMTPATYGVVPQVFVKFVPSSSFNIMVGKLPTLIGAEYTFTFENTNVQRGLLWNQENAVSRGVQANYTKGALTVSLSWNDGLYSNEYTWGSALVSYAVTPKDTLSFVALGDYFGHRSVSTFVTPLLLNNSQIYNTIYTHTDGPWMISPYFQYTYVPQVPSLGIMHSASTTGVALLAKYSFSPTFSLGGRGEYISASGGGVTNLLYGPDSNAWSLTLTPTFQWKIFYLRGELSYVKANKVTPSLAFGSLGLDTSQGRALIETGVLF